MASVQQIAANLPPEIGRHDVSTVRFGIEQYSSLSCGWWLWSQAADEASLLTIINCDQFCKWVWLQTMSEKRLTTLLGHLPPAVQGGGREQLRYTLADSCAGVLTSEQRQAYERDGFLVVKGLVAQQELNKYRERFRQLCTKEVVVSKWWFWLQHAGGTAYHLKIWHLFIIVVSSGSRNKRFQNAILSISLPFEHPAAGPGKFMVCMGHRLQCKIPNHKFPWYGAEKFEGK